MKTWTTWKFAHAEHVVIALASTLGTGCSSSSSAGIASDSGALDGMRNDSGGPTDGGPDVFASDAGPDSPHDSGSVDAPVDAPPVCAPDASFTSDPANCGACGHSCFGGACSSGQCQEFDIQYGGPGQKIPTGPIVCQEDGILWADEGHWTSASGMILNYTDGAIYALPNSSTTPQSLTPFPMSGFGVASDGTNFFFITGGTSSNNTWLGDGKVLQCPLSGCSASPLVLAAGNPADGGTPIGGTALLSIGTAGSSVYWSSNAGISEAPIGGGSTTLVGSGSFFYFTTSGSNVYWATSGFGIWRRPIAGGAPTMLQGGNNFSIYGLVVDAQNIYVMMNDNMGTGSYIASCPAPDCTGGPQALVGTMGNPTAGATSVAGLGQDATSLFWTETEPTKEFLMACAKANCNPTVVSNTQILAGQMCITDKAITWASANGIGRIAR